ncbi:MAG: cation-transporting P-type ATPase [Patescibacteria group bacterium]
MTLQQPPGLTTLEATNRLQQFGKNALKTKKKKSLIIQFLEEFKDFMVIILIVAGVISFAAGDEKDGAVITGILILNAIIGFSQKFRAERAIEALQKMLAPMSQVMRDGKEQMIKAEFIVPGDVMIIAEGDRINADGIVLEENEFETQESILTGESVPVKKTTKSTVFAGTSVARGNAKILVQETGMKTAFGKIAQLTAETEKDLSPLQKELNEVGIIVGKMTIVIAGILILIGIFLQGKGLIEVILFAASVAVAAVPEGLPATVTIALALGVQRLAQKKAIMKQLSSVETLGSTTIIVTDKTGTLTKNEMSVREIWFDGHDINLSEEKYIPEKELIEAITLACCICTLCNNAKIQSSEMGEKGGVPGGEKELGDPTEIGLLRVVEKMGLPKETVAERFQKIHEHPFDSVRKRMSVIVEKSASKNQYVFAKGAPGSILNVCTKIYKDGKIEDLTEEEKQKIIKKSDQMAEQALRVLALAYKQKNEKGAHQTQEENEKDLIFLGLIGMMDPPRLEVPEAIEAARKAGIQIIIATGDNGLTAAAIAKMIGLIKDGNSHSIITGEELEKIPDEKLTELLKNKKNTLIFARVSPQDKLRIVSILKNLDEVVAVTGDGVNDAPALKRADIGIAMGIMGTDVTKEAANMVLSNDSFATIVVAIEEGRTIYQNLKKFLMYILSGNIGELVVIFIALIIGLPTPFSAITILLVNVGTDVFPALALGIDPPTKDSMEKPPRNPKERIMQGKFLIRMGYLGALIGITTLATYIWSLKIAMNSELKAGTIAFATLVLGQMINAYNSRSDRRSIFNGFFENFILLASVTLSIFIVIAVTEIPGLQEIFEVTKLNRSDWLIIAIGTMPVLIIEETRKFIMRKKWTSQT